MNTALTSTPSSATPRGFRHRCSVGDESGSRSRDSATLVYKVDRSNGAERSLISRNSDSINIFSRSYKYTHTPTHAHMCTQNNHPFFAFLVFFVYRTPRWWTRVLRKTVFLVGIRERGSRQPQKIHANCDHWYRRWTFGPYFAFTTTIFHFGL